jgi:hypothetical protein
MDVQLPQTIQRDQHGRGVRAAAAQSALDRNALVNRDADAVDDLVTTREQARGAHDEVAVSGNFVGAADAFDHPRWSAIELQLIAQIDDLHRAL